MNLAEDNYTIEVKNNNEKIELNIPIDADVYTWANTFRTIMYWATFMPETIEKILPIEEKETILEENYN